MGDSSLNDIIPIMRYGLHLISLRRIIPVTAAIVIILAACQTLNPSPVVIKSPGPAGTASHVELTPYLTSTASQTPLPPNPATSTPFPTPTSTPRSHIVKKGEDLYGIAFQYGLTLQELQTANPGINPNFLSIDTVLQIPASSKVQQTPGELPSPTPAGALTGATSCYRTGEGGLWCFTSIKNQSKGYIEGVSLKVRLGAGSVQVTEGSALTVINLIPPGADIPAAVYFPPFIPNPYEVDVTLETSLPVSVLSNRYIPGHIENLITQIARDGKSAAIQGEMILDEPGTPARVSVAAVAFNSVGDIVGFRRWEKDTPAAPIAFSFQVYSLSGEISRISVFTEAAR